MNIRRRWVEAMKRICLVALVSSLVFGQNPQAGPAFEVASVKPAPTATRDNYYYKVDDRRADMGSVSLDELVRTAYHDPWDVVAPPWLAQQTFEVHATFPAGATKGQLPEMLQAFLAERFGLKAHHEERTVPVFAMTVAKDGPKFKQSPPGEDPNAGICKASGGLHKCTQVTMESFAGHLSMNSRMAAIDPAFLNKAGMLDRPVVDMTGLSGKYTLEYFAGRVGSGRGVPVDPNGEVVSTFDGLKALGLKLEATKHTFEILVVDHIERLPTEN